MRRTYGMPLFTLARRAVRYATWFAVGTLVAGALLWMRWREPGDPTSTLVLGALLAAPGLVLLHFTRTMSSLPARIGLGGEPLARGGLLRLGVGLTFLLRPWYWALVAFAAAAGLVMMPLAVVVTLLGR